MRPHGKTKLGSFPLPTQEAERLRTCLTFDSEFSALDACVGDGAAFTCLLKNTPARRYSIEIDANRAEQARRAGRDFDQLFGFVDNYFCNSARKCPYRFLISDWSRALFSFAA